MHPLLFKTVSSAPWNPAYLIFGNQNKLLIELSRQLAQGFLCTEKRACGLCVSCKKFEKKCHPDFLDLTPEKGSLKIEAIREIFRKISLKPFEASCRVVCIQEADRLSDSAANALLKTLEEPPPSALILIVTTIPERLLPTIRSRCHRLPFFSNEDPETASEEFLSFWKEKVSPSLSEKSRCFDVASRLAEECQKNLDDLTPLLLQLKKEWHRKILQTGTTEKMFADFDRILETERALEGNVLKTAALERLFWGLMDES